MHSCRYCSCVYTAVQQIMAYTAESYYFIGIYFISIYWFDFSIVIIVITIIIPFSGSVVHLITVSGGLGTRFGGRYKISQSQYFVMLTNITKFE